MFGEKFLGDVLGQDESVAVPGFEMSPVNRPHASPHVTGEQRVRHDVVRPVDERLCQAAGVEEFEDAGQYGARARLDEIGASFHYDHVDAAQRKFAGDG